MTFRNFGFFFLLMLLLVQNSIFEKSKVSGKFYNTSWRYYDPKLGCLIQADTQTPGEFYKPLGLNRYLYAFGNPFKYIDPSGHTPHDVIRADQVAIHRRIPYIKKIPGIPFQPARGVKPLGQIDPSLTTIHSGIVLAHTQGAEHLMSEIQKVIGDQGNLIGIPMQGANITLENKGGLAADYVFYGLAIQQPAPDQIKPESYSYKLSKDLQNLFELTSQGTSQLTSSHHYFPINIFVGDGQTNPFLAYGGGATTYTYVTENGDSASAIYLDINSQATVEAHEGPPIQLSLGVKAIHEILFHAGDTLKRRSFLNPHNTFAQDLLGIYDPGNKFDNERIISAYNENNPDQPISERAHHRYKRTPQIRKILDSNRFPVFHK